jgi:hypothetical protein
LGIAGERVVTVAVPVAPIVDALDAARFDRIGELSRLAGVLCLQLGEAAHQSNSDAVRAKLAQICLVTIEAHDLERALGKSWEHDLEGA